MKVQLLQSKYYAMFFDCDESICSVEKKTKKRLRKTLNFNLSVE